MCARQVVSDGRPAPLKEMLMNARGTLRVSRQGDREIVMTRDFDVPRDLVFDALISRSKLPVLVDFWAPWCGPCKMVAPEFRKVAQETAGQFVLAKVNTEEVPSLAARFRVTAIPTMTLFRNGLEVARQAGAMPAPQIRKFIEQHT